MRQALSTKTEPACKAKKDEHVATKNKKAARESRKQGFKTGKKFSTMSRPEKDALLEEVAYRLGLIDEPTS